MTKDKIIIKLNELKNIVDNFDKIENDQRLDSYEVGFNNKLKLIIERF